MSLSSFSDLWQQSSTWLQRQIPLSTATNDGQAYFDWDNVTPHRHFQWQPCFGDFQCARLQVPMDWTGGSAESEKTVEVAVVKVEATVPVTDPTYGGAVILNPGGPGGSGIGQVLRGGHAVRTVLSAGPGADQNTAKNFDILGFDPRGVNNTRPLMTCFPDRIQAAVYTIEEEAHGYIGSSDTSFDNLWASKRAVADGCSKRTAKEGIAKHVDTAPVARDIIEIFEQHGIWREKEAQRLLAAPSLATLSSAEKDAIAVRTAYQKDKEMVQYWGFSYGTVLGATLSAMYPDRIKRAVLDGVADSHDYMAGGWSTNLRDTDLTFVKMTEYCYNGGRDNCPLWHEDGPAMISEIVQETIADFEHNPISIPDPDGTSTPEVVTSNDLRRLFRDIVYGPLRDLPKTVQVLYELSQRNGTTLAKWTASDRPKHLGEPLSKKCKADGPYSPACMQGNDGALGMDWAVTYSIACSDANGDRLGQSKEDFKEYADKTVAQSKLIGASWASIMLPCTAWHARPHWRYEGKFHNTTAHPILFAGNTIDPVTPLYNAFLMSKGFPDSGVLHQDSEGHCTYGSVSLCSGRSIREYFQSGTLPGDEKGLAHLDDHFTRGWKGKGKLCSADIKPLSGYGPDSPVPEVPEGEEDQALWEALVTLNRVWP